MAKCLAGICTGWETMILSSMTACDAIAITLPVYSTNLLFSSVHPNLKQWRLRKSSPRIKGLVIPLHTINLCIKLHGPIWKLTSIDPFTPTSWPFAVLIQVLLSEIWCKSSNSATVSYLMQLTCAPVLKREEKARSFTLILKVVPLVLPVFITNTSFSTVLLLTSSFLLSLTSQADEFPEFSVDSFLSSIAAALSIWSSVTPKACIKLFLVISFTCLLLPLCSLSSSRLSFKQDQISWRNRCWTVQVHRNLNLNLNLRHLYSAPHEPCEGFQVRFTLLAAQANHLTVSHQYEKEPPSPRSTPWGAYRSASLMRRRSSFSQAFSAAIHTHTHTW